jgi:hypothetical protein
LKKKTLIYKEENADEVKNPDLQGRLALFVQEK